MQASWIALSGHRPCSDKRIICSESESHTRTIADFAISPVHLRVILLDHAARQYAASGVGALAKPACSRRSSSVLSSASSSAALMSSRAPVSTGGS
jgi:hypothetical protein